MTIRWDDATPQYLREVVEALPVEELARFGFVLSHALPPGATVSLEVEHEVDGRMNARIGVSHRGVDAEGIVLDRGRLAMVSARPRQL
jgi:hypothetical protein